MGFEVTYKYHERLEDGGGYNKDETKEINRKVGDPFEDVSLERLASTIMQQLARRDIWVVGVNIVEYSKKEISFKETKGGIIIKNKKFVLDELVGNVTCQDIAPPAPVHGQQVVHPHEMLRQQQPVVHPHELLRQQQPVHPHEALRRPGAVQVREQPPNRNLAYPGQPQPKQKRVVFAPSDMDQVKMQKVFGFTVEKEYPVLAERMNASGVGLTLVLLDDMGRQQEVSDEFFIPTTAELVADRQLGFTKPPPSREGGGNLDWKGVINDDIPDVRGRR